jgi:hypothetical protein
MQTTSSPLLRDSPTDNRLTEAELTFHLMSFRFLLNLKRPLHIVRSQMRTSGRQFVLREALDRGVCVGLSTDVAGGYSIDIMGWALGVSRMLEGARLERSEW